MKTILVILSTICASVIYSQQVKPVWETKQPMKLKRTLHSMAECGGKIYVVSGSTGEDREFTDLTSVEMYDPESNQWSAKAELPKAISLSCAVTVDNKIFVAGGEEESFAIKSKALMMYDCSRNKWSVKSSMNIPRSFHCAAVLDNKIYAIGGRESGDIIKSKRKDSLAVYTIEEYDINTDKWKIINIMPFKHFTIGAVTLNNKIFILSDTTNNSMMGESAILEEYDPATNTFTKKAELVPSKCDAAMIAYKGKIYIFGGWRRGALSSVHEYDPAKNKWTQKTDMPFPVQSHQAVVLNDNIYISGGIIYKSNSYEKKNDFIVYHPDRDNSGSYSNE